MQNQSVLLCEEIDEEESADESEFVKIKLVSMEIKVEISQLFKYSKYFRENYKDIFFLPSLSNNLQQYQKKFRISDQNALIFFKLIQDERVVITNQIYFDLYRLSDFFKATKLLKILDRYSRANFNDINYVIQKIIISVQNEQNDSGKDNLNTEMERLLINRINECLTSQYFGNLPGSTIYRIISKSDINQISMDLLFDFINNSFDSRHTLLQFLNIGKLSESKFNELYQKFLQCGKSYIFFQYIPIDLDHINMLKNNNKELLVQTRQQNSLINQIQRQLSLIQQQKMQIEREKNELQARFDQLNAKYQKQLISNEALCKAFTLMYGNKTERNMKESIELLKNSSNEGNGYASFLLGLFSENGEVVNKNFDQALLLYQKSSEQGISYGLNRIGYCYENGFGVDVDYQKAFHFYTKSAEKGNSYALCNLGICYFKKHGVPKNINLAIDYTKQSAEKNNPRALCNLGIFYSGGLGVEQNDKTAYELIKKSADLGDKIAMKQLADIYEKGKGVEKNSKLALMYNMKASEFDK